MEAKKFKENIYNTEKGLYGFSMLVKIVPDFRNRSGSFTSS